MVTPSFGGAPVLTASRALGAFAYAAQIPLVGYVFSRYFGMRAFATVCGLQVFIQAVFVGLAAPAIGRSVGLSGHYDLVLMAGIGAEVLAALLYLSLPAYRYAAVGDGDEPVPRAAAPAHVRMR